MTQENKELLLKDLCVRLPYGVEVTWDGLYPITLTPSIYAALCKENRDQNIPKVYLRPMSSITEDEAKEFDELSKQLFEHREPEKIWADVVDWLNKHHFDYRGLIEKGLALEAPEGMYNL